MDTKQKETDMNDYIDQYGVVFSEDRKILIKGNNDLEEYTVPKGTEAIGQDAWGKMDKLKIIHLPEGLLTIEPLAFSGCMGLTDIKLPSSIINIGSYAFEFTMLHVVVIPEGITILRNDVFGECFGLATVVLPNTLETIEEYAFSECPFTQLFLLSSERRLNHIAEEAFDGSNAIFIVPFNLQESYLKAFPVHEERFYGLKINEIFGKAEVYSPQGIMVGEVPVEAINN